MKWDSLRTHPPQRVAIPQKSASNAYSKSFSPRLTVANLLQVSYVLLLNALRNWTTTTYASGQLRKSSTGNYGASVITNFLILS
jgi:hypothetical protein